MSLLTEAMEDCTIIDRITKADGYGGYISEWVDGAPIKCAIVFDSSMQARIAETQGVKALYIIIQWWYCIIFIRCTNFWSMWNCYIHC